MYDVRYSLWTAIKLQFSLKQFNASRHHHPGLPRRRFPFSETQSVVTQPQW